MSRPSPAKLDVCAKPVHFELTAEHVGEIERACGVSLTERDQARTRANLEEALDSYLVSATASAQAPAVYIAADRLDKMRQHAFALHDLVCTGDDGDDAERRLRERLLRDLDVPNYAVSRLRPVLGDFLKALVLVEESLTHRERFPDQNPCTHLASELDITWRLLLGRKRTISGARKGTPFIRFVMAATACLPSHWPWRPHGRREPQSLNAFAQAVRRSLEQVLQINC